MNASPAQDFQRRKLILGSMPRGANPEQVLAVGPSCFVGLEEFFPDWETSYIFAPEPLTDPALLRAAARAAQALAANIIPRLAAWLSPQASALPDAYWQTLLAPWAVDMARQIIERHLRVQAMIQAWEHFSLEVDLLPAAVAFSFEDEQDFILRGALGTKFNHWLLSRLLEARWPSAWRANTVEPETDAPCVSDGNEDTASLEKEATSSEVAAPPHAPLKQLLANLGRRLMLALPFPRLKGMSSAQALQFSLSLLHTCHGPDHSLDLGAAFGDQSHDAPDLTQIPPLPLDPLPLFQAACPESLSKLQHPRSLARTVRPRLRVASVRAYEDAIYRQRLACWRGRGHRLAYAQHGGNYGMQAVTCEMPFVEYSQDAFFTWGWQKHGAEPGNFIPLPSPQLAGMANAWRGSQSETLIFVGTEMAVFGYRLDSHPMPLQMLAYREDKEWFFEALGRDLQEKSLYRPYFSLPGCLEDAAWLLPRMPRLKLCTGPLLPQILNCRLLVLDHPGTSLLEGMAANVPMTLYWNREQWELTPEADALLEMLASAGIWFPTAEEAAIQARKVWSDTEAWWQSEPVQAARRQFCQQQALIVDGKENPLWTQTLKAL